MNCSIPIFQGKFMYFYEGQEGTGDFLGINN